MRYIYPSIEQLDLAGRLLRKETPSQARFALILTDNIVELILHQTCTQALEFETMWTQLGRPKYPIGTRDKVLGKLFEPKVKFCRKIKKLSQDEAEFVLSGHKYRNELYHAGIRHDDMIYDLAWEYHELACRIFSKLKPDVVSSGSEQPSAAVVRHLISTRAFDVFKQIDSAARSLAKVKPAVRRTFAEALSLSLESRIEETRLNLEFLVHDNPQNMDEKRMIVYLQAWQKIFEMVEQRGKSKHSLPKTIKDLRKTMATLERTWKPPIRINPTPRWKRRAISLRTEKDSFRAMKKHQQLNQEMSVFESLVSDSATSLDRFIDNEVDRARGK